MRRSIRIFISLLIVLLYSSAAFAQSMDDVEISTHPVADDVYMLTGQGGNIGLAITSDGAFLIDDQFAPLTEKILVAIAEVTDQPGSVGGLW